MDANTNPNIIDGYCTTGTTEAISESLQLLGNTPENPTINGYVLNNIFKMIFENINHQKKKGFSFWESDKSYEATINNIDICRQNNKIYFCKQTHTTPKSPSTNPDYWTVLYDLDKPLESTYALINHNHDLTYAKLGGLSSQVFKVKAAIADLDAVNKKQMETYLSTFLISIKLPTKISPSSINVNGTILTLVDGVPGNNYYFSRTAIQAVRDSQTIGGFHYGLTPENELLSSYGASSPTSKTQSDIDDIKGINKYSIWTLWHQPENGIPEGKALIQGTFWRDIYPADENYAIRGYSSCFDLDGVTPAKIAGGAETYGRKFPKIPLLKGGNSALSYGKLTQFNATEIVASCGMELISYAEFQESSFGVVEEKSANQLGYTTNGIISHIPELTSKYGIEMAAGVQWFWTKELLNGYGSTDFANRVGLTDTRGYIYATSNSPVAMIVGGQEQHTTTLPCGSRALHLYHSVWVSLWPLGFVGVCRNMKQN